MMIRQWEVWYAEFVYDDDITNKKKRPVLILDNGNVFPILVAKITKTEPRQGYWGEYRLKNWQNANLDYPSTIRLSKTIRIEEVALIYKIGLLDPFDISEIQRILSNQ